MNRRDFLNKMLQAYKQEVPEATEDVLKALV